MNKAREMGVDADYIFTGTKRGKEWAYARAYSAMLSTIEMLLGLEENRLEEISLLLIDENNRLESGQGADYDPYNRAMMAWLQTSTKPERCLDIDMFTRVLTDIEAHVSSSGKTLDAGKKIKAAIMLYRAFQASGKVDQNMIGDTIALASF